MLKWLKRIILLILLSGLAFAVICMASYLHNPSKLPIKTVAILGVPAAAQNEVQTIISQNMHGGLLQTQISSMQLALEKLPWVDFVEVTRVWPNELKVLVKPQSIVAYWNDKTFLNQYMETIPFFSESPIPDNLPKLYGPDGSQVKAGYYYQIFSQVLTALNLTIIQLQVADNGDLSLLLDNGINIQLGQQHVLTRLNHFVKVYGKVFGGQKDLSSVVVDLRYPSGMAVRWGSK